jgi:hypothetical protein
MEFDRSEEMSESRDLSFNSSGSRDLEESHSYSTVGHAWRKRTGSFNCPTVASTLQKGNTSSEDAERPGGLMVVIGDILHKFLSKYTFASVK